jgi:hypothetical protein
MTYLGNDPDVLTSWDYGHLTTPAATVVAQAIADATDGFRPGRAAPAATATATAR